MTAGFYSPLPPARTGVADYSAALLAAMRARGEVRVNAEGDVNLYHLGNNGLHAGIYRRCLERPGVVVLHDAVLHHFLLGALSPDEYVAEFVYNYGAWHEHLAGRLWRGRARSGVDPAYFRYPLLKRAMENARAVIVHNAAAARMAREHGAARVYEIPHLSDAHPAPPGYEVARLRERMGVGARVCLFGVFGHLRESKRLATVLRAFAKVENAALLVAGEFASSDLARAMEPMLKASRIIRVGYTPEQEFQLYSAAVDAAINLRYPPAGESSGIAVRLMGAAKPVILTSGEETSAFPEATCLKVDAGVGEQEMLAGFMAWLAACPGDGRAIGERAAAHIAARHDPALVAAEYWRVLESVR